MDEVLSCRKITKVFPGVTALDEVDFSLQRGEIHALVGENGAGKSTLMNILGGVYQPDSGDLFMDGHRIHMRIPRQAEGPEDICHPSGTQLDSSPDGCGECPSCA